MPFLRKFSLKEPLLLQKKSSLKTLLFPDYTLVKTLFPPSILMRHFVLCASIRFSNMMSIKTLISPDFLSIVFSKKYRSRTWTKRHNNFGRIVQSRLLPTRYLMWNGKSYDPMSTYVSSISNVGRYAPRKQIYYDKQQNSKHITHRHQSR